VRAQTQVRTSRLAFRVAFCAHGREQMQFAARQRSPLAAQRPVSAGAPPSACLGLQYRLINQAPLESWGITRHRFALRRVLRAAPEVLASSSLLVCGREYLACSL
jgi:hypothetical protein